MDDDVGEEEAQNPPFTGRWTTTSFYDVYMVDTPEKTNNNDKEDPVEDKPPERQPKRQLPRRRSKSRHSKDCSTGTGKNNTPDDAKNNEDPVKVTFEQGEQDNMGKIALKNR